MSKQEDWTALPHCYKFSTKGSTIPGSGLQYSRNVVEHLTVCRLVLHQLCLHPLHSAEKYLRPPSTPASRVEGRRAHRASASASLRICGFPGASRVQGCLKWVLTCTGNNSHEVYQRDRPSEVSTPRSRWQCVGSPDVESVVTRSPPFLHVLTNHCHSRDRNVNHEIYGIIFQILAIGRTCILDSRR